MIRFATRLVCAYALMVIIPALVCFSPPASAAKDNPRVLVLHSYHQGYLWTDQIMTGIYDTLGTSFPKAEIYVEYMNTKRLPPEKVVPSLKELYALNYSNVRFDAIIASDNNALDFLLLYRDRLFPGVPVVFCGINNIGNYRRSDMPDYTGVSEDLDIVSTIEVALDLHPGTRKIAVITDVTETGQINLELFRKIRPRFREIEVLELSRRTVGELQNELGALGDDTIVLNLSFFRDRDGLAFTFRESMDLVVQSTRRPVYTVWDFYMVPGVMGGKLLSGHLQGEKAAALAGRVLRGEEAGDIPVLDSPTAYMFDFSGLQKYGIAESRLPAGSVVLNRPDTFYSRYGRYVWLGTFLFMAQMTIIGMLVWNISRRHREEAARRAIESRYQDIFENSVEGIFQTTIEGKMLNANPSLARMFGYSSAEEMISTLYDVGMQVYASPEIRTALVDKIIERGYVTGAEVQFRKRDGSLFWASISARMVKASDRDAAYFEGFVTDISSQKKAEEERSRLEAQLIQAQKMEAVGRLTGGIAHDFNNILTALVGYANLLQLRMGPDSPLKHYVEAILASLERATALTQSLLTFSRKQPVATRLVSLNGIVSNMEGFLRRLIGEDIELKVIPFAGDLAIMANSGQIEQVLMNLATNARDAMRDGGVVTISMREENLSEGIFGNKAAIAPGRYALLTFSDTGTGMDEGTLDHVFEPFFTRKGVGKGTGLGLSIAYAVISQHGGHISVYSEKGHGTIFKVYLPLAGTEVREVEREEEKPPPAGTETILVAEDDDAVRELIRNVLESAGYYVLQAAHGEDAVRVFREKSDSIDLLLFDVIMPRKNGREAYEAIRLLAPAVKILFMSGYTTDLVSSRGILDGNFELLTKPIAPHALLRRIREILDRQ